MVKFFLTYAWAIVWTMILACFTYWRLVGDLVRADGGIGFENKLIEMHTEMGMLIVNLCLVAMLFIDNFIVYHLSVKKRQQATDMQACCLMGAVLFAASLTVLAPHLLRKELVEWIHLWPLFMFFLVALIIYKAESLRFDTAHRSVQLEASNIKLKI